MSGPAHALVNNEQLFREIRAENGKFLFRIQTEKLRYLEFLVREGIKRLARNNLEIGGLIIGSEPTPEQPVESWIDFVPVEIRHQFGPRYRACEADQATFEEVMAGHPPDGQERIIGCYRSHLAEDVEIREEDRWLLEGVFGERAGLLVLVHATVSQSSVVHVYGAIGAEVRLLCRFLLQELSGGLPAKPAVAPGELPLAPPQPSLSLRPQTGAMPVAHRPADPTLPDALRPKTGLKTGIWIAAFALMAMMFAFAVVRIGLTRRSGVGEVAMSMKSRAADVELTWNADSPAAKNAVRALLVVADGPNVHRFELNAAQLRTGTFEYVPVSRELTCQLMFYQPDNAFAGETKVFSVDIPGPDIPVPAVLPSAVTGAGRPEAKTELKSEVKPGIKPGVKPAVRPAPGLAGVSTGVIPASHPAGTPPAGTFPAGTSLNNTEAAPVATRQAAVGQTPRPPVESPPVPVAEARPNPVLTTDASPPVVRQDASPAPGSFLPPAVRPALPPPAQSISPPASRERAPVAAAQVSFQAPVPSKRVNPAIPPGVRALLHNPATIRIVVHVTSEGKVQSAAPANEGGGVEKLLSRYAVQAAKSWQFEPARQGGVPVAGEAVVVFQFAPERR
jgi:protein TonB